MTRSAKLLHPVSSSDPREQSGGERALLVGIHWPGDSAALTMEYMDELKMLAETAGAEVVGSEIVKRQKADPATLVGRGKVSELAEIAGEVSADLLVFDEDLAPAQARNLEKGIGCRVIDRTGLILDIFARRARTREARTQVELAQLRYLLPRLAGAWLHLERQRGGIGMRGPGETQIETDRRIVRTRIRVLEEELKHIERVRHTQRKARSEVFRFALAGYTNVGKSSLMNALTKAGVFEENLLFATLDSTTRSLPFAAGQRAVLTDTVGFIRKLPPALVASFRSTLAEISEADCILHVVDVVSPSWPDQVAEVDKILAGMGLAGYQRIMVFNKIDIAADAQPGQMALQNYPAAQLVSARTGQGLDGLLAEMKSAVVAEQVEISVSLGANDGRLLSELYRHGGVLDERQDKEKLKLRVRIPLTTARRLRLVPDSIPSKS
ncbi:MAG: GTPase HflX [bacterium]|nr:GTPase HflX [bacterium]